MVKKWSSSDQNFLGLISYISIRVTRNKRGESVDMHNISKLVTHHSVVRFGKRLHLLLVSSEYGLIKNTTGSLVIEIAVTCRERRTP